MEVLKIEKYIFILKIGGKRIGVILLYKKLLGVL